jgi:hypothetical protein
MVGRGLPFDGGDARQRFFVEAEQTLTMSAAPASPAELIDAMKVQRIRLARDQGLRPWEPAASRDRLILDPGDATSSGITTGSISQSSAQVCLKTTHLPSRSPYRYCQRHPAQQIMQPRSRFAWERALAYVRERPQASSKVKISRHDVKYCLHLVRFTLH